MSAAPTPIEREPDPGSGLRRVHDALQAAGKKGDGKGKYQCPAHDDRNPSLGVRQGERGAQVHCFAGCDTAAVCAELGLKPAQLFDDWLTDEEFAERVREKKRPRQKRRCVARYTYTDRNGEPLSIKERWEPGKKNQDKDFQWTGADGRACRGEGNPDVLYNLPAVVDADVVHLGEGEKAADKLSEVLPFGHAATCPPAGTIEDEMLEELRGKRVTLWIDRDAPESPALKKAGKLFRRLKAAGLEVEPVRSRTTAPKDDAFDHIAAGFAHDDGEPVPLDEFGDASNFELVTDTPARPRLRAASFDEVMEDTVPDAVVERLLYEESPTLYCGLPKRGKSHSVGQMTMCLAAGHPFLGLTVRESRVLYLSWELSIGALRSRMIETARDVGLPDPIPLMRDGRISFYAHRREASAERIDLATDDGWEMLRDLIEDTGASVLVIDTLSKVAGLEMKDTTGWHELLTRLNEFCRSERVAVLAIDHASRLRMEENASTVAMGSQAKGAAVPAIVKLSDTQKDDPREKRWKLDVDSWYGDAGAPVWFRRPEVERAGRTVAGSGCILADAPEEKKTETGTARCEAWLREELAEGVMKPKQQVLNRAESAGFAERTVERAFGAIGGQSDKGYQGRAQWRLPER